MKPHQLLVILAGIILLALAAAGVVLGATVGLTATSTFYSLAVLGVARRLVVRESGEIGAPR